MFNQDLSYIVSLECGGEGSEKDSPRWSSISLRMRLDTIHGARGTGERKMYSQPAFWAGALCGWEKMRRVEGL